MNTTATPSTEFDVVSTAHPMIECPQCSSCAVSAIAYASATGSRGGTYRHDTGQGPGDHSAVVSRYLDVRISHAELDRRGDFPFHSDGTPCVRAAIVGDCAYNHRYGPTWEDAH